MLSKAIRIAAIAFEGKFDKGGIPYILHCLHVMNGVSALGEDAMIVGVLHDLIEDTRWTLEDLVKEGFSYTIISAVALLTHNPKEAYVDYIKEIAHNPLARAVKMEDLKHNSDIMRLKGRRKKDFDRLEKYCSAYEYLKN